MLRNLHVKNLALIDEMEVEFEEGLNILTGETGAGKSLIIGSINMALGQKVPKEMIKEGADYALVELIFEVKSEDTIRRLQEMDIFPEDGMVIMSRKITGGRSVAKINSESISAAKVKEAAQLLIDIHGQHEHQSLTGKKMQLALLDDYAKEVDENVREYHDSCNRYEKLQKQLDEHIDFAEKRKTQRFYKSEIQRFSKEKGEKEGRIEACKKRIETTEKEMQSLEARNERNRI